MKLDEQKIKERILRLAQVIDRTGLSRSTIYLGIKNQQFPKPVSIGTRCIGWPESEIDSWIFERIQKSRNECKP